MRGWAERIRTSRRRFVEQPSTAGERTHNVIGLHANFGRYFSQMDKTPSGGSNPLSPGMFQVRTRTVIRGRAHLQNKDCSGVWSAQRQ
jgi:hypothetical protein